MSNLIRNSLNKAAELVERRISDLKHGEDACYRVTRWSRYLAGREASDDSMFRSQSVEPARGEQWPTLAREVFSNLYGDESEPIPEDDRPKGTSWMSELHRIADELPAWQALRKRAAGDPWVCGMAAAEVLEQLSDEVEPPRKDAQRLQDHLDFLKELMAEEGGASSPDHMRQMANVRRQLDEALEQDKDATARIQANENGIRSVLRDAAKSVTEQLDETEQALSALGGGWGTGNGNASRVDAPRAEIVQAMRRNPKLRRVAQMAGRLKAAAIRKQAMRARPGHEELCDVNPGSDLQRLVPSELVNLATPDTEALLYRKLQERSALTYELRGREQRERGPIIMCVDESGSMSGHRDEWAKAVALSMMEVAARQNRAFSYVHFSSSVSKVTTVKDPKRLKLDELESFVDHFAGGGTRIATALFKAAELIGGEMRDADVVLISDGCDHGADQDRAMKSLAEAGASVYGVAVDSDGFSDAIQPKLEGYEQIEDDDVSTGAELNVLGI